MLFSKMHAQNVKTTIPKKRSSLLKWNGWGYKDSGFDVRNEQIYFTGKRYPLGSECAQGQNLVYFTEWAQKKLDIKPVDREAKTTVTELPNIKYPDPKIKQEILESLSKLSIDYSLDGEDRLDRSHGQSLHEIFDLRSNKIPNRIPDLVVWPTGRDDVINIVQFAINFDLMIIPVGGATNVSGAITTPGTEFRTILSLDMTQMNKLLWLDVKNLTACFEAGVVGQDMEHELQKRGFTSGHEPDSFEFSSLGGWVATRASGMKRSLYGNIEDLVVNMRMVTPRGTLSKSGLTPRISSGPDFNHLILGSEGTLGIITDVVIKIRPLPELKKYNSFVFNDFTTGVKCMHEIAMKKCQPASIRLMDNEQFHFGQALRYEPSFLKKLMDKLKHGYLFEIKGFDIHSICVMTLLFEGDKSSIAQQEKKITTIAKEFGGICAGEKNGEVGYRLTFVIAYIRDLGLTYNIVAESFETSVPWDKTLILCKNVKNCMRSKCEANNIKRYFISCRVTQTYDQGCCVYFYFAFNYTGLSDPVKTYELIETIARDEIIACGGSISHHHGVGKARSKWYPLQVSELGVELYKSAKNYLDPNNIFGVGNLCRI